ncbi:uncharacterized protein LOC131381120 isoform X6 [Hylobates moloch]|uniref:uncharacterized protein LOC131381120 isoform X6 n=1 Tax=Hylobates moloch TaxID=81572 RepID=UPI0026761705|nr:uncharacterized protein LOC131381120 isoform X6 [Hylobates moloch]XP_058283249.1 uncharacterized protein LOC131381120 isoform X6 [Hylobates moloch]
MSSPFLPQTLQSCRFTIMQMLRRHTRPTLMVWKLCSFLTSRQIFVKKMLNVDVEKMQTLRPKREEAGNSVRGSSFVFKASALWKLTERPLPGPVKAQLFAAVLWVLVPKWNKSCL